MDGVHDLGGFHGMGKIAPEPDEPIFHDRWEAVTFASMLAVASGGYWTTDESRHAIERMPAAEYLTSSYYEHWLAAIETLCVEKGVFTREEHERALDTAREELRDPVANQPSALPAASPEPVAERWSAVEDVINLGGPASREVDQPPRFKVGQHVRARKSASDGHTRLARYVRGSVGEVVIAHGAYVFPDVSAQGYGEEAPQHVYAVRFDGVDLWGAGAEQATSVTIDLWESYLEPD